MSDNEQAENSDIVENRGQASAAAAESASESIGAVPYARFKEVNEKAKALEAQLAKQAAKIKAAEAAQLTEQQKWKELAELRAKETAEIKGQLEAERLARLRLSVASEHNLPPVLAERLHGSNVEEMTKDAMALIEAWRGGVPGVPPRPSGKPAPGATAEQMRDPEYVRKNKAAIYAAMQRGEI